MGCGASNESEKNDGRSTKYDKTRGKTQNQIDEEEEEGEGNNSQDLDDADVKSAGSKGATFSTSYASQKKKNGENGKNGGGGYNPNFNPDERTAPLPWQAPQKKKDETSAEEFVFGDFAVDPNDVQKQRLQRINRVKKAMTLTNTKSMSSGATFHMNDFTVVVDESDDWAGQEEEPVVVAGNRTLKACTMEGMLGHTSRVKTIAIAPHEKHFASASMEDSAITLTNMGSGEEVTSFIGHISPIIAASFSRDGKYLATSSRDNSVIIWDVSSSKEAQRKQCLVWDVARAIEIVTYEEHEGVVVCVAPLQGQDVVATGGGDRIIRMWNTVTGQTIRQFIGHDGVVISISFTADGEKILSNDDRACKVWAVGTGACLCNVTLDSLVGPGTRAGRSAPTPLLKAYYEKNKVPMRSYGFGTNGILGPQALNACRIAAHRSVLTLSCLCPGELSNSYFAVASTNKTVYIVSIANGKEVLSFTAKSAVFAIAAGKGNKIVFGDIFGNIYRLTMRASEAPL